MKDVFISHSWGDKETFVEPLVAALQAAGLSCWYDVLDVQPGDSLVSRLNEGLTGSKVILFCLSENFLQGKWSQQELWAVVGLATLGAGVVRMVPLMLADPAKILQAYPVPFAGMAYLRWDDDLTGLAARIKATVEEVGREGHRYWSAKTRKAAANGNWLEVLETARQAADYAGDDFPTCVLRIAALLRVGRSSEAMSFVHEREKTWEDLAETGVDIETLDFVQDRLSAVAAEDRSASLGKGLLYFLATEANGSRAWRYLARLFDRKELADEREHILLYAAVQGQEAALDWMREVAESSPAAKVREALAGSVFLLGSRFPKLSPRLAKIAEQLTEDESEKVRSLAVIPCYFLSPQGPERALRALFDRSPEVRDQALELLSGEYNMEVGENWETDEGEDRPVNPLLTEEVVRRLLTDPDDFVLEHVVEIITEGRIPAPSGVDLLALERPPTYEVRAAELRRLDKDESEPASQRLFAFARDDPDDGLRARAAEALAKKPGPIAVGLLRDLLAAETVSRAREAIESLIVAKGDSTLSDLYLGILRRKLAPDDDVDATLVVLKVLESGDQESCRLAVDLCRRAGRQDLLAAQGRRLVARGFVQEAEELVAESLQSGAASVDVLLLAGLLPGIGADQLEPWRRDGDLEVRIAALRTLEWKRRDGRALAELRELLSALEEGIVAGDSESMWRALEVVDGILEIEGREKALEALEDLYERIYAWKTSSFPLRAAWERLKILGVTKPHDVYEESPPTRPSPWPDRSGPFFGIRGMTS